MPIIELNGDLTIETINSQVITIGKSHLSENITIDLSKIGKIDTAGIAMLLDLQVQAHHASKHISYINTPDNIKNLCDLYQIIL